MKRYFSDFFKTKPIQIISYPKSGNTWIRFLLANYLYDSEIKLSNINYYIPDYELLKSEKKIIDNPKYIKRHSIPDRNKFSSIYIYRDGRDVAVSYYYYLLRKGVIEEQTFSSFFKDKFIGGSIPYGSWNSHINTWFAIDKKKDSLNLKYENILQDPEGTLEKILKFSGLKIDTHRVTKSVYLSSIQKVKENEQTDLKQLEAKYNLKNPDYAFFRKGIQGDWKNHFNDSDEEIFIEHFSDVMKKLNYF